MAPFDLDLENISRYIDLIMIIGFPLTSELLKCFVSR